MPLESEDLKWGVMEEMEWIKWDVNDLLGERECGMIYSGDTVFLMA